MLIIENLLNTSKKKYVVIHDKPKSLISLGNTIGLDHVEAGTTTFGDLLLIRALTECTVKIVCMANNECPVDRVLVENLTIDGTRSLSFEPSVERKSVSPKSYYNRTTALVQGDIIIMRIGVFTLENAPSGNTSLDLYLEIECDSAPDPSYRVITETD